MPSSTLRNVLPDCATPWRVRILAAFLTVLALGAHGAEFRTRLSIPTPAPLPPGATAIRDVVPVDPSAVERAVRNLFGAYSADPARLEAMFGETLRDRSRLLDTLGERLPPDAKLKVLGIQAAYTLSQTVRTHPATGRATRVSTISVVVRSQLEFNDPVQGFQRLEGVNEYLLSVEEPVG